MQTEEFLLTKNLESSYSLIFYKFLVTHQARWGPGLPAAKSGPAWVRFEYIVGLVLHAMRTIVHKHVRFRHNREMVVWVIDDLASFISLL